MGMRTEPLRRGRTGILDVINLNYCFIFFNLNRSLMKDLDIFFSILTVENAYLVTCLCLYILTYIL